MNAQDAITVALKSTQNLLSTYLSDLSDADLLVRPVPGANHIAWQIGHLIGAEHYLASENVPGVKYPPLPAGFAERYTKETAGQESTKGYLTKAEYLKLFNESRQATVDALAKLTPADLDKPTAGKMAAFAPKVGDLFILLANHTMMHAGQFTVVRRKLGKPILM
jgi:DinB superfamily